MMHFANTNGDLYYISTNPKVMLSTLRSQPHLREIDAHLVDGGQPHYLLVRDPFQRLVSFYRDKFELYMEDPPQTTEFNSCYQVLFPYLGIDRNEPVATARKKLSAVSFDQFVPLLLNEDVISDIHLRPQANEQWRLERILKMESPDDYDFLGSKIDTEVRERATGEYDPASYYTPKIEKIAAQVYAEDFEALGYSGAA